MSAPFRREAARPARRPRPAAAGTGLSAAVAGPLTRLLLRLALGSELPDELTADDTVVSGGGTVVHVGPLTDGARREHQVVALEAFAPVLLPRPISRATVVAAVLEEAEGGIHPGQVGVPLSG